MVVWRQERERVRTVIEAGARPTALWPHCLARAHNLTLRAGAQAPAHYYDILIPQTL